MAESLESRKFDRKPLFDVPLPVRSKNREAPITAAGHDQESSEPGNKMAFSLLTKRGNRQQVGPRNARQISCKADLECYNRLGLSSSRLTQPLRSQ